MANAIYVHLPFCVKRCSYCDFYSQCDFTLTENYVSALKKEIERNADTSEKIDSVFFGGGTPSSIPAEQLCGILEKIKRCFNVDGNAEITVECNPESITESKLSAYRENGVNRLSIGVQSAHDKTLKTIGRAHSFFEAQKAISLAQKVGFENINVDLILGLPNENTEDVLDSVKKICALPVTHLSLYALELYENTVLYKDKEKYSFATADEQADAYYSASKLLSSFDFTRYEVSNFAKKGRECRHNLAYWNCKNYYGFGAAAAGYLKNVRYVNCFDAKRYVELIEEGKSAVAERDVLSKNDCQFEYVMLSLMKSEGINLKEYSTRFKVDFFDYCPKAQYLLQKGVLLQNETNVYVNPDNFYLLNSVLTELL